MVSPSRILDDIFEVVKHPTAGAVILLIMLASILSPYAFLVYLMHEFSPGFFARMDHIEEALTEMARQQGVIIRILGDGEQSPS